MKKAVIILGSVFIFTTQAKASNFNFPAENQIEHSIYGKSPFHLAISKGDIEAVKKFVLYGVNINKMVNNMTPLMVAARFNQFEIMQILVVNGADASIENSQGFTALQYAEYSNATKCITFLETSKQKRKG
ncbi:ankyrin repeat domain-containing protein [Flavobacterium olei]|uniref:ankyrin repeat domain-containing protein n=1 Tax=Flavobacterium olei TaxID=1886782 RepID=UPI00321AF456